MIEQTPEGDQRAADRDRGTDGDANASETSSAGTAGGGITRRGTLRAGALLGAGSVLGIVGLGAGADSAAAQCNRPDEVIHLDYDDYDSWDDVYRLSNGDGETLNLVRSPTASGETALQLLVREGDHWGASTHYDFSAGLFELTGRVRFALDTSWEMTGRYPANCRLWNCAIARGEGSAGGGMPDGTNGWSNRMYITNQDSEPDGPFYLLSHTYHMDENQDHDFVMDGEEYALGQPDLVPGNWYEFEYYVRVNTVADGVANSDGIVRYWLDDELVYERENVRFTEDHDDNIIDTNGPVGHYGGQYTAPQNLYAYYDDHSMALNGTFEFDQC